MRVRKKISPDQLTIELSHESVRAHATGTAAVACVAIIALAVLLVLFLK